MLFVPKAYKVVLFHHAIYKATHYKHRDSGFKFYEFNFKIFSITLYILKVMASHIYFNAILIIFAHKFIIRIKIMSLIEPITIGLYPSPYYKGFHTFICCQYSILCHNYAQNNILTFSIQNRRHQNSGTATDYSNSRIGKLIH